VCALGLVGRRGAVVSARSGPLPFTEVGDEPAGTEGCPAAWEVRTSGAAMTKEGMGVPGPEAVRVVVT
jgi:hypothetical protein